MRTVITTIEELDKWMLENKRPVMAIDTETTSLKYLDLELTAITIATEIDSCYINMSKLAPSWVLCRTVDLHDVQWVMHRAVYDLQVFKKYGFTPRSIFCTMVGAQLCDCNRKSYSLDSLAKDWLGSNKTMKYKDAESFGINSPEFIDYAITDAELTFKLYGYEYPILKKANQLYLIAAVETPFLYVQRDMEINGVLLDKDRHNYFTKVV
ncbi:MAG: hypothetical protein ACFFDN_24405, partial [Candidatus Hodarchaeota archaeon]